MIHGKDRNTKQPIASKQVETYFTLTIFLADTGEIEFLRIFRTIVNNLMFMKKNNGVITVKKSNVAALAKSTKPNADITRKVVSDRSSIVKAARSLR